MGKGKKNQFINITILSILVLSLICGIIGLVLLQKDASQEVELSPAEAKEQLEKSVEIVLEGDLDQVNQQPTIMADGVYVGKYIEKGLFDYKGIVELGGKQLYYIEFYSEQIGSSNAGGTSYAYYNSEGDVFGYAEESSVAMSDGTQKKLYYFYDEHKEQKEYYLDENDGYQIIDENGTVLVHGNYDIKYNNRIYQINIETLPEFQSVVALEDKLILYECMLADLREEAIEYAKK